MPDDLSPLWEKLGPALNSAWRHELMATAKPIISAFIEAREVELQERIRFQTLEEHDHIVATVEAERDSALARVADLEAAISDAERSISNDTPNGQMVHHFLAPLWAALENGEK